MVNTQLPSDEILRLPLKQLRLKDSVTHQRAFVKALFSVEPREFNDKAGIFIPNQVYESYLAAIWDDFWILDAEKHMIKTLDDLVSVVSIVKKHCRSQKEELLQKLISFAKEHGKDTNSDKVIHMLSEVPRSSLTALQNTASLELAVKVWLLADFQMYAKRVGERTRRDWALGESLCNQIRKSIRDDSEFDISSDLSIRRRFSPRFNLYDMDRLTLVQIKWTNNIAKHLYLEEDRRFVHTVHIFSHTTLMHTVAQELRQSSHVGNDTESDLAKLLLETMDTLDLLLDLHDSECQNWYRKLRKKDNKQRQKENRPTGGLDENAGTPKRPGSLAPSDVDELRRVGHYDFWQPRLLKLETAFKESKPRAIGGWWRDKRDRGIWATFIGSFLAILIAVFAIVVAIGSIVTGSMSVELAEDANKMAAKGLDKDTVAPLTISNAGGPPLTTVTVQSCCSCTLCDMSGPRSNGSVTETRVIEQVAESTPCT